MRNFRLFSIILFLTVTALRSQAQLMGKIEEIFSNDIFFVRLKEVHAIVQGEEGKAVPLFLEKTMKNPQMIEPTQFRKEKEQYYQLCKEYNDIIDDIITTIQGLDKLKELREVNLVEYRDRINGIGPKFEAFFQGLSKYHQEAAILGILIDIYKLGKPIIQELFKENVERIKRILCEQLRSFKIVPISWEATEAVVVNRITPSSQEEIRAKVGVEATPHYRSLNLAPGSTVMDIQAAHAKLTREYAEEIASTSNLEIKEFFRQLSDRVEAAKRYFDANPPVPPAPLPNQESAKIGNGNGSKNLPSNCGELKGEINGLLQASEFMSKEQLIEKIRQVVGKY